MIFFPPILFIFILLSPSEAHWSVPNPMILAESIPFFSFSRVRSLSGLSRPTLVISDPDTINYSEASGIYFNCLGNLIMRLIE